jgi:hypothetical protein
LLLSVPAERCAALVEQLQAEGALCAAVVGRVEPPDGARITLVP